MFQLYLGRKDLKYGIIFMIILSLLTPNTLKFSLGPISLNVFNLTTAVYFVCCIKYLKREYLIDKVLRKYLIYLMSYIFVTSFLLSLGGGGIVFWIKNTILTTLEFFLVAYTFLYIRFNDEELRAINMTILSTSIFIAFYAIFNYVTKSNPYVSLVALLTDTRDAADYFINEQRGVLSGRVSSTFANPLILGQMMLLILSYLIFLLRESVNKKITYGISFLLTIPIILSGSRSALLPLFLLPVIYLFQFGRQKIFRYILIGLIAVPVTISLLPKEYKNTVEAVIYFWDDKKSDKVGIAGSSNNLRIEQHLSALKIINGNPLFGKGNGYVNENGSKHREMLGYEGMFLYTLVDWGFLGTILFLFFYFYLYRYLLRKTNDPFEKVQVTSLCSCYFISCILTGISYSSFSFFFLLYFLTLNRISNNHIKLEENIKAIAD